MAKHHEQALRSDSQYEHPSVEEPQSRPTAEKRAANGKAADAAIRRMASVEGDDTGMLVDDVGAQRIEVSHRADRYFSAIWRAVNKFQSILRRRHAESAIEKKIGWKAAGEKFKEHAIDYLTDKLGESVKEIATEAELVPGLARWFMWWARPKVSSTTMRRRSRRSPRYPPWTTS